MKKIVALITAVAVLAAIMAGCKNTPDTPIVVGKNVDILIDKATETDDTAKDIPGPEADRSALAQRLGVPERFTTDESFSDGRLKVHADAEIFLPDVSALPVVRVEPADFSQELADRLYRYLVGNTPMYQQQDKPLKSQIQDSIVDWQRTLNDPESADIAKRQAEQELEKLQKAYEAAADSVDMIPAGAEIKLQTSYHPGTGEKMSEYTGVNIAEKPGRNVNEGKVFSIKNNNKNGEIIVKEDEFGATVTDTASQGARFSYSNYDLSSTLDGITLTIETVTPETLTDKPEHVGGLSYKEAQGMAQEFISGTGIDNVRVSSMTLNYVLPDKYTDKMDLKPIEKDYGTFLDDVAAGKYDAEVMDVLIDVDIVRTVNGVDVTSGGSASYIGDAMFGKQWRYEDFTIELCKKGIRSVGWTSPHHIIDTVTEDANMRPFDEIEDVFGSMYRVTYDDVMQGNNLTGSIDHVTLSLRRIMEQNNIGYGLFVPAWDFYGTLTVTNPDYPEDGSHEMLSNEPLLTINAIDGSVIDLDRGY